MWTSAQPKSALFGGTVNRMSVTLVRTLVASLQAHMQVEGLFRLAADTEKMQLWTGKLEADPNGGDLGNVSNDPHLIANLLKRYLRSLVPPLLTHDLYEDFLEAAQHDDGTKLGECVARLPPNNLDVLMELLGFFEVFLEHKEKNRMDIENLATVLAPCIITKVAHDAPLNLENLPQETAAVSLLLRHASTLRQAYPQTHDTSGMSDIPTGVALPAAVRLLAQQGAVGSPGAARRSVRQLSLGGPKQEVKFGTTTAYAVYDYKGCMQAGTLTMRRGDALVILEAEPDPSGTQSRWYRCRHSESNEEGWCPVSFLDCPAVERTPLGREKALMRAGTETSLPTSSPLRDQGSYGTLAQLASQTDPLSLMSGKSAHSLEEMSDRMDLLSRALIREKEERLALERRLQAALEMK